jgi:two-component system LytT family response regulator
MKKIEAIIVEDEKGVRDLLNLLIKKYCPQVKVVGLAGDIETAFRKINEKKPDLVFLDVQMPRGNGFDLLKKFDTVSFDVVFTTSHNHYALQALKAEAIDYLLKPFDIVELNSAVEKVIKKRKSFDGDKENPGLFIQVHKNDIVEKIDIKEVVSFEAKSSYTVITTYSNDKFIVARVLAEFEELTRPLNCFLRIHRGVLVNCNSIKSYSKTPPYMVTLSNNKPYEISRRKRSEVMEILKNR